MLNLPKKRFITRFTTADILERGVEEIIDKKHLVKNLRVKKLRVKLGIDPTGPDLHLGHTIVLWKLRQFQDAGHTAVIIIGDYTAQIGDPSGKGATRAALTPKEVKRNAATYKEQIFKILLPQNLEIHRQSEWFKKFTLNDLLALAARVSAGRLLAHDTFRARLTAGQPLAAHELLYPLLQGYDSVAVRSDVELGASEQKFNLLVGRDIQKYYGQEPQDILTTPYLIGTDGREKMSKSMSNYISLQERSAYEMFSKIMSINDDQIPLYFEFVTPLATREVKIIKSRAMRGKLARDLKLRLARLLTSIYWGERDAQQAQENFARVFQKKNTQQNFETVYLSTKKINVVDLLVGSGLTNSKSEAKRVIGQGGAYINNERIKTISETAELMGGEIVRVGRRKAVRLELK